MLKSQSVKVPTDPSLEKLAGVPLTIQHTAPTKASGAAAAAALEAAAGQPPGEV